MNWILVLTVFYYHAPFVQQIPGFASLQACETAAVVVNKKFTSDAWINGGSSKAMSVCISSGAVKQ